MPLQQRKADRGNGLKPQFECDHRSVEPASPYNTNLSLDPTVARDAIPSGSHNSPRPILKKKKGLAPPLTSSSNSVPRELGGPNAPQGHHHAGAPTPLTWPQVDDHVKPGLRTLRLKQINALSFAPLPLQLLHGSRYGVLVRCLTRNTECSFFLIEHHRWIFKFAVKSPFNIASRVGQVKIHAERIPQENCRFCFRIREGNLFTSINSRPPSGPISKSGTVMPHRFMSNAFSQRRQIN
ncbi:hypothetical protein K457DRAFT_20974 [Linnemannia elongata AG-77]|uniref:Uncharacterized protein n=1 Tax=Linnemannia elongata AG-77 TaxID=1314771 RepID=A0A197JR33_9FUNG|nr:hypothetical protein K457DRAFT_20974 [Linnemannia elongata AG-77]